MEEKYKQIVEFLQKYIQETDCQGFTIGISGGKDSTVVAKLLVDAIGKENVFGVLMPNGEQKDILDSINICQILDIDYMHVNIEDSYNNIISQIEFYGGNQFPNDYYFGLTDKCKEIIISDKAKTNIVPRLRMTTLYTIAQSLGYRVVGTGNKSEQFIGWFTKWGDGACDINPIAHLTCTEVIALGDYLGLPKHLIHKTPADGLTGKSDEDNFGFSYDLLDSYIRKEPGGLYPIESYNDIDKIIELHYNSRHKFAPVTIE